MTKHFITHDETSTVDVTDGNSEWILKKGVTLSGAPALLNDDIDAVHFDIRGGIISDGYGIEIKAAGVQSVVVSKAAQIVTDMDGVRVEGGLTIQNAGLIKSVTGSALFLSGGDFTVANTGTIVSKESEAINLPDCSEFTLTNDGLIRSMATKHVAVSMDAHFQGSFSNSANGHVVGGLKLSAEDGVTLVNKGTVEGGIVLGGGDDSLVSRGTISQSVRLGDGEDTADLRWGNSSRLKVKGEDGDDTFIVDNRSTKIVETADGGNDTIKTSVSYTLRHGSYDHIETLTALGGKDVKLTGNQRDNTLAGNSADNGLAGGKGDDDLIGLRGNDVLTGGGGSDDFYFYASSGVDKITDFKPGLDNIFILNVPGIAVNGDLDDRVSMAGNGKDTIVNLGDGDRVRLVGVDMTELNLGDDFIVFG